MAAQDESSVLRVLSSGCKSLLGQDAVGWRQQAWAQETSRSPLGAGPPGQGSTEAVVRWGSQRKPEGGPRGRGPGDVIQVVTQH